MIVATITEVESKANAKVSFTIDNIDYSYNAITTIPLQNNHIGREALLSFNRGDIAQPIVTGVIQVDDGEPLTLSCEEGILLTCGRSRIELDESGTLNLNAEHINSQAYGPHRIKGASVKIN